MFATRTSGYRALDPCDLAAEHAAEGLAALSRRHRELLVETEADPTPMVSDETNAADLSWVLIEDPEESALHVDWRATAWNLVVAR